MTDIPDTNETVVERLWREVREVHKPPSSPGNDYAYSLPSNLRSMKGQEDDPLIPTQESMNSTWDVAEATWQSYVGKSTGWPAGFFDPFMLLSAIPQLPHVISRTTTWGRPIWAVPDSAGNPTSVNGRRTEFCVSRPWPLEMSYQTQHNPQEIPASMTILTLCWSYILSVNLLERQGSRAIYATNHVRPSSTSPAHDDAGAVNLQLPTGASGSLIEWICALVTPGISWIAEERDDFPIWAINCPESPTVRVSIPNAPHFDQSSLRSVSERRPGPNFKEAVQLFSELCRLCDLDKEMSPTSIPTIEASFMAALSIPHYQLLSRLGSGAQAELPPPYLCSKSTTIDLEESQAPSTHHGIADYCNSLGYFMALSTHDKIYKSMPWTIFWQPGIPCNLVSSWFGGIQSTLRPMLDRKDFGKLLRTFAARRPRVALMWLGTFLLGGGTQQALFDDFDVYLQGFRTAYYRHLSFEKSTLEMGPWTGSAQSFWDYELDEAGGYYRKNVQEPLAPGFYHRSEVLQRTYNARLWCRGSGPDPWEPLSSPIPAAEIEPELDMTGDLFRRYLYFVWSETKTINRGFCYNYGVHHQVSAPPDDFELVTPPQARQEGDDSEVVTNRDRRRTFLGPSKRATAYYLTSAGSGISGKGDYNLIKQFRGHPWVPKWMVDWMTEEKEKAEEKERAESATQNTSI